MLFSWVVIPDPQSRSHSRGSLLRNRLYGDVLVVVELVVLLGHIVDACIGTPGRVEDVGHDLAVDDESEILVGRHFGRGDLG